MQQLSSNTNSDQYSIPSPVSGGPAPGDRLSASWGGRNIPVDCPAPIKSTPISVRRTDHYQAQTLPEYKSFLCEIADKNQGDHMVLEPVDVNLPAAELILRMLNRSAFIDVTCSFINSELLKAPYFLHELDETVRELVGKSTYFDIEYAYKARENPKVELRFKEVLGEEGEELLKQFSGELFTDKLKVALLTLHEKFRNGIDQDDIILYSRLSEIISKRFEMLKNEMDQNKTTRRWDDLDCRILDALHKSKKCFEYILG